MTVIKLNKRVRWSLIAGGIAFLVALVVFPLVAKEQAIQWIATHTSRTLIIDSLRINPLTLGVTLRGVSLSEAGEPATPFVAFDRLDLALSLRSIWERAVILRKLRLEGAKLRLVRIADNTYNFADLQALGEKKPGEAEKKSKPLLFSLNNISLVNGRIDFIDRALPVEQNHIVSDLNIGVPFLGNIPYLTNLYVTPSLSAKVNGSPFVFAGKLKPFKDGSETTLDLSFDAFDLATYLPYLPKTLPLQIKSGLFDSKVTVAYRVAKDQKPEVEVAGRLHLANFASNGVDGAPLATLRDLDVEILPSRPLDKDLIFKFINISGLHLSAHRNRLGAWNLPGLLRQVATATSPQDAEESAAIEPDVPLHLRVQTLRLTESAVAFHDELPAGGFRSELQQINAEVKDLDTGAATASPLVFNLITSRNEALFINGGFALKPLGVVLDVKVERLPLVAYYPYLQRELTTAVSGLLTVQSKILFDEEAGVRLVDGELLLEKVDIPFPPGEGFSLPRLVASGLQADLNRQSYHLDELLLEKGTFNLSRFKDGRWSPLDLIRKREESTALPAVAGAAAKPAPHFTLSRLRLNQWQGELTDETVDNSLPLHNLNLAVDHFDYPAWTIDRIDIATRCDEGQLHIVAGGRLNPLDLTGRLQLKKLPLPRLWAYIPPKVRALLVSGDLNSDLRFDLDQKEQQLSGAFRGSLGIGNLYLVNADNANDLLRWENFHLEKMALDLGQSRLTIAEIALSGLVTQLTITPEGQLNFSQLLEEESIPPASDDQGATLLPPNTPPPAPAPSPRDWFIAIDQVTLQNGRIDFTDRHMSPPFHARMINLGGRISGLSSSPAMQADVDLHGNLANQSPLQIVGTMNPLSSRPQADLNVTFSDIELSPITPYAGRYIGYTVEKGKLFLNLNYQVVNNKLAASNKIFLDQLTFGSSVESADAINLPVKLAVALLKDRNGEIHLDVPVTGNLDDPKFSVWGIVWKVLKNILVKAATSPLSLLTAFVGEEDFSAVQFSPGSAALSTADKENLAKLAKALAEKPSLKLQLTGHAEANVDADPYRRQLLENQIQRVKFLELARNKELAVGQTVETTDVTVAERPRYLKEVYRQGSFPKPRNVIGLLKDLPEGEMEKLILSHTIIGAEQMSELAWARSSAVKKELVEGNGLPAARIFENNVMILRPQDKPENGSGTRVEFGVATD